MFKNKSFNVKMIDDEVKWTPPKITYHLDSDEINTVVKQTAFTLALAVGGVIVAKNLSFSVGNTLSASVYRIIDVKFPYPPFPK